MIGPECRGVLGIASFRLGTDTVEKRAAHSDATASVIATTMSRRICVVRLSDITSEANLITLTNQAFMLRYMNEPTLHTKLHTGPSGVGMALFQGPASEHIARARTAPTQLTSATMVCITYLPHKTKELI